MTKLMPANWEPPYPAYVTDVDTLHLNFSQLAVQAPDEAAAAAEIEELTGLVDRADNLLHREAVHHIDAAGWRNDVLLAYWDQPDGFERWRSASTTCEFLDRDRNGDTGLWLESFSSPAGYYETSYSRATVDWGVSRHQPTREDPVHAYYGAMRDRIAAAEDGGVPSPVSRLNRDREVASRGRHLSVTLPPNLCFIRTVQGWLACSDEERDLFMERTYPVYQEGVEFLRTHSLETNCVSARLVTNPEHHPDRPQSETLAWFLSLTDLEAWTWSHPTHAAIFNTFMEHAKKFDFDVDILLGHEVSIVPEGAASAEYHNCDPATGFLRFFESADLVAS